MSEVVLSVEMDKKDGRRRTTLTTISGIFYALGRLQNEFFWTIVLLFVLNSLASGKTPDGADPRPKPPSLPPVIEYLFMALYFTYLLWRVHVYIEEFEEKRREREEGVRQ
jgi:hypothetical protein